MQNSRACNLYHESNTANHLVEYRGNFKEQIDKVSYACGDIITESIGVISLEDKYLEQILIDVPAIIFIGYNPIFVLEETSPSNVDNINTIKISPYLNLTGRGVLVGIIDTGIDYLNQEFIREDGTSRILSIWDQSITTTTNPSVHMGEIYTNEQINQAIAASKNNQDPYQIVPSRDEIGHGTKVAGIIGARGYAGELQGVAHDCDFVIVKLSQSSYFKKLLSDNGIVNVPVYNASELIAALEHVKNISLNLNRPMVISLNLGTTDLSHDTLSLTARYIASLGNIRGICTVIGVGNEGDSQGHASGTIVSVGDSKTVELRIPREMKQLGFRIVVQKPSRVSLRVISPTGESSTLYESKIGKRDSHLFVYTNTIMEIRYLTPEHFTGHEMIQVDFKNIKPGIWKFQITGEYIVNGRFDIWLPPKITLPEGTVFLEPDPYSTLSVPSTALNIVTVAYFGENGARMPSSGRGYNTDGIINPDVATLGTNILTTQVGGGNTTLSGSSAAASIVAGASALLLEWGIVKNNDRTMHSRKIRSYLYYGAYRNAIYKFPNRETGYGDFDLLDTFNIISRSYGEVNRDYIKENQSNFHEYNINNLFIRIPK
ncbi:MULTISPECIES: S8 family peptidase [Clostridium]|uniref:S8 family peptidase n=1 Tax=Clostridium cibarium TaxID=2762247 RepID=A0ABR8PW45_9CLOT|nr:MULTISPECIES: S8 family peptidase [Clostridium]MBD7912375.1 S8 family peptidase [Clostridium cibarium]